MPGCEIAELTEILQLVNRQIVACQVQQTVEQHRGMAIRQHEAVAVGPERIRRIVFQVVPPEDLGNIGHAKRSARMPRIRGLYRIHG